MIRAFSFLHSILFYGLEAAPHWLEQSQCLYKRDQGTIFF